MLKQKIKISNDHNSSSANTLNLKNNEEIHTEIHKLPMNPNKPNSTSPQKNVSSEKEQ